MPRGHDEPGPRRAPRRAPADRSGRAALSACRCSPISTTTNWRRRAPVQGAAISAGETVVQKGSGRGVLRDRLRRGDGFVGGEGARPSGRRLLRRDRPDRRGTRMATITAATELVCYGLTFWDFRPLVEHNGVIGWKLLQATVKKLPRYATLRASEPDPRPMTTGTSTTTAPAPPTRGGGWAWSASSSRAL